MSQDGSAPAPRPTAPGARLWLSALLVTASAVAVVLGAASRRPTDGRPNPTGAAAATADSATPTPTPAPGDGAAGPKGLDAGADGGAPGATCRIPDRGFGPYRRWRRLPTGALLIPDPPPGGDFDLLLHFHGAEAVRKVLAPADLPLVISALDAGEGSLRYEEAFYGKAALDDLIQAVTEELRSQSDDSPKLRHLILSSWSAGYGAVRQVLLHQPKRPAAVILLDSLHASYTSESGELATATLEPFVERARRAAAGEGMLLLSHSEIRPPGFASTSETATYVLHELDGQRRYAGLVPVAGVELKTRFRQGGLIVRGYTGTSRSAHCAHLTLLPSILRNDVLPSLASPPPATAPDGGEETR